MKRRSHRRVYFGLLLAFFVIITSVGAAPGPSANLGIDTAPIDPYILEEIEADGRTNIFVKMATDAGLGAAEDIGDREGRLQFVYDVLTSHASRSQSSIVQFLKNQGIAFQSFWINNSIYLYDADLELVNALAMRDDVAYLRADHKVPLHLPVKVRRSLDGIESVEWNISRIHADDVWAEGITGEGIVVANIDTGVRYTHEAIVNQYRGNNGDGTFSHDYNWYDPNMNLSEPSDNIGHGTHTMGTMVGGDGTGSFSEDIGVAPGAEWIASKGCGILFCSDFRLIASAQWIACPTKVDGTNPDCSKAPHVVNNSWGGGRGNPWYESYVRAWLSAGIAPVFSAGNSGPNCRTVGSPGDYTLVVGVGATDNTDVLADFSGKGPGSFRRLKPDFVAPGDGIRSSVNLGNSAYALYSGTSMAAPHVSGTISLMLSANPDTGLLSLYNALRLTTMKGMGAPPGPDVCGGRSYAVYPNAIYGWGMIDAQAAVDAIMH
ncbi:MAG: S8 family serine peptidase [Anaerolineales bacterium]|nr:S8 family serine peptidase [Anaerolineales bacterium]